MDALPEAQRRPRPASGTVKGGSEVVCLARPTRATYRRDSIFINEYSLVRLLVRACICIIARVGKKPAR